MADVVSHIQTRVEAHVIMRQAQRLRAQAMATLLGAAGRGIANGVRRIGRGLVAMAETVEAGRRAQALHTELTRMSDRQLAEAGVTREDIPLAIAGAMGNPRRTSAPAAEESARARPAAAKSGGDLREAA